MEKIFKAGGGWVKQLGDGTVLGPFADRASAAGSSKKSAPKQSKVEPIAETQIKSSKEPVIDDFKGLS